jgi:hypothetical protein
MRTRLPFFVVLTGAVALTGALLGWQRHTGTLLRARMAGQRSGQDERARLESEHKRLVAAQASPAELARLRAERAAVSSLVAEIEAVKRRAETTTRSASLPAPEVTASSLEEKVVPARLWQRAGQATPAATFETALWAAAGGDVDTLAGLLAFDAGTRTKAEEIFATLPAGLQQELGSAERLVALLTAKDVPLGSAQILIQYPASTDMKMAAELIDPAGKAKELLLTLRKDDAAWRLVVPVGAIERYAAWLQAPQGK